MNQETLITIAGALSVIALYSVLFKENVVYRFFEHVFLGLAGGYALVALWKDTLYPQWWTRMTGTLTDTGTLDKPGNWAYIILLPIGLMAYTVFSKKNNWMSRVRSGLFSACGRVNRSRCGGRRSGLSSAIRCDRSCRRRRNRSLSRR